MGKTAKEGRSRRAQKTRLPLTPAARPLATQSAAPKIAAALIPVVKARILRYTAALKLGEITMAEIEHPQICLITPPVFDADVFPDRIKAVLDAQEIACLRLSLASRDEDEIARAADVLREIAHARDVAIVVDNHVLLADRLGLDGVHLTDSRKNIRKLRTEMGPDAIIGAFCNISRHEGMTAAEAGADYVAFGPVGESPLGDGSRADRELFELWSESIEVPVIAEGALTTELIESFAPFTDFFAIGNEIWGQDDALAALRKLLAPLS